MYKALEEDAAFLRRSGEWLKGMFGNRAIVANMFERAKEIDALLAKARGENNAD